MQSQSFPRCGRAADSAHGGYFSKRRAQGAREALAPPVEACRGGELGPALQCRSAEQPTRSARYGGRALLELQSLRVRDLSPERYTDLEVQRVSRTSQNPDMVRALKKWDMSAFLGHLVGVEFLGHVISLVFFGLALLVAFLGHGGYVHGRFWDM